MWRIIGPIESVTGVLMCGLSVSRLFAIVNRLVGHSSQPNPQGKPVSVTSSRRDSQAHRLAVSFDDCIRQYLRIYFLRTRRPSLWKRGMEKPNANSMGD